jgi:4a-hydroxytetrahydrobiopterin dehydratase
MNKLIREYPVKNLGDAVDKLNKAYAVASKLNHHPEAYLDWKKIRFKYWTHDTGGVTKKDYHLADMIDRAVTNTKTQRDKRAYAIDLNKYKLDHELGYVTSPRLIDEHRNVAVNMGLRPLGHDVEWEHHGSDVNPGYAIHHFAAAPGQKRKGRGTNLLVRTAKDLKRRGYRYLTSDTTGDTRHPIWEHLHKAGYPVVAGPPPMEHLRKEFPNVMRGGKKIKWHMDLTRL